MPKVNVRRLSWFVAFLMLLLAGSAGAVRKKVFDLPLTGVQLFERTQALSSDGTTVTTRYISQIPKLIGLNTSDVLAEYCGGAVDASGGLIDISGNGRDLALAAGTATRIPSSFFDPNGNPLEAFSYNGSTYHSAAHSAWMNFLDTTHSMVFVVANTGPTPATNYGLFEHFVNNTSGAYVYYNGNGTQISASYHKSGGSRLSTGYPQDVDDGCYHIYHVVRVAGHGVFVFTDGMLRGNGSFQNMDTYGVDGNATLYLGRANSVNYVGNMVYARLQSSEMTFDQIKDEVDYFKGIVGARSAKRFSNPPYYRSPYPSATYNSFELSRTGSLSLLPVAGNWPINVPGNGKYFRGGSIRPNTFSAADQRSVAAWTQNNITTSLNSATGPDGTAYLDTITETVANGVHSISKAIGSPANTYKHIAYFIVKPGTQRYVFMKHDKGGADNPVIFDLSAPRVVSMDTDWVQAGIETLSNGTYMPWAVATGNGSAWTLHYGLSDGTNFSYAGDVAKNVYIGDMHWYLYPFLDAPRHTSTNTYVTDYKASYFPLSINKDILTSVAATPSLLLNGSEPVNATGCSLVDTCNVTPTTGAYTFSSYTPIYNGAMDEFGPFFHSDYDNNYGQGYLELADGSGGNDFDVGSQKLSFVFIYQPTHFSPSLASFDALYSKYTTNVGLRIIGDAGDGGTSTVTARANSTNVALSGCLESGKPSLITVTVDGSGAQTAVVVRADACAAASNAALASIANSGTSVKIGKEVSYYNKGRSLLTAIYRNYIISADEHSAMYTRFKKDGILPTTMSATTPVTKMSIEFDARIPLATGTIGDFMATGASLVEISGGAGTATAAQNIMRVGLSTAGKPTMMLYEDSDGTQRYLQSAAGRTDFDRWHKFKAKFDFANTANSSFYVDGIAQTTASNMTGTGNAFNFSDVLINLCRAPLAGGGGYAPTDCELRNVQLFTE